VPRHALPEQDKNGESIKRVKRVSAPNPWGREAGDDQKFVADGRYVGDSGEMHTCPRSQFCRFSCCTWYGSLPVIRAEREGEQYLVGKEPAVHNMVHKCTSPRYYLDTTPE
jgi:hypothetical protein